ncbi:universal stress protein [Pseudozobellia thermophila]|uniref:Nucleotide-binding universal stress protein, UspA family n=1 Tax=Pseudozobellia thermophila TaxID=192903 RepID=A0A1M6IM45_9FLAO|nr:universal stress protein [Pseudozobellia thermophila]SHJ35552.1 Nucleotide-binding universal stress protein, UspA family [Pseudozobellia thermophila]
MKNILIPTDFSNNAWNAITYGMELFKKKPCTFYIINVHTIAAYPGGEAAMYMPPEVIEESILHENKEKLDKVLHEIERLPTNTKHTFHTEALYGFFTDLVKEQVKKKNIDLIIMGTKGASGLRAVSLGSNTGNVITKVPCAVLAVPEDAEYKNPKEIGFPTDFQLNYNTQVMKQIRDFAVFHKSALRFLYVSSKKDGLTTSQSKNREFLKTYFAEIEHSFHTLTGKKLDEAVQHFVESRELDMIVMVAKNLNFLERILFRPTVEKISYHTKVPFLVLHE